MLADNRLRQIVICLGELERVRIWNLEHPGNHDLGAVIGECDWRDELQYWIYEAESLGLNGTGSGVTANGALPTISKERGEHENQ